MTFSIGGKEPTKLLQFENFENIQDICISSIFLFIMNITEALESLI